MIVASDTGETSQQNQFRKPLELQISLLKLVPNKLK